MKKAFFIDKEKSISLKINEENFIDIKVGDIVIVYDDVSHDYVEHKLRIDSIEYNDENKTKSNPKGMICYGTDLDEEYFGDDYISIVTENNFIRIER